MSGFDTSAKVGMSGSAAGLEGQPRKGFLAAHGKHGHGGAAMKSVRNVTILIGLALALFGLAATGVHAQMLPSPTFGGTFTLPFAAQWGRVMLPAGHYSLYYGNLSDSGAYVIEVIGKEEGSPHGFVLPLAGDRVAEAENVIVCVREGRTAFVRELRMGEIGQSLNFARPHGERVRARLVARSRNENGKPRLAKAPTRVEVVSVRHAGR